jgi:putative phosphoesterase
MKLAIISDIHDNIWNLRAALSYIAGANVDTLMCCGDLCSPFVVGLFASEFRGPIHVVAGNNEGDIRQFMLISARANKARGEAAQITFHGQFFEGEIGGKQVAMNHYPEIALAIAAAGLHDLVCFGHNHQYEIRFFEKTMALNPGALMGYNPLMEGDVKDIVATFALYDTGVAADQGVQFYQVTEPWRSPQEVGTVVPFAVG